MCARRLIEESLTLCREADFRSGVAIRLHNLGRVVLRLGDAERARSLLQESLRLARDLGIKRLVAFCLTGVAGVETAAGCPKRAARLFGAADVLLGEIGARPGSADRTESEHDLLVARRTLGDEAFARVWREAWAMTLEQVIAYALEEESSE